MELMCQRSEGGRQAASRGKSVLHEGKSKCKGPEPGAWECVQERPRRHKENELKGKRLELRQVLRGLSFREGSKAIVRTLVVTECETGVSAGLGAEDCHIPDLF